MSHCSNDLLAGVAARLARSARRERRRRLVMTWGFAVLVVVVLIEVGVLVWFLSAGK